MRNNHPNLTYAYHFLSEAIIIFLIAIPILYHRLHWVPYGSYLLVIVGTCIIFSTVTQFTNHYAWYLLSAPILFFVFYFSDYPIGTAAVFSALLVWRYIDIRKEEVISRENIYILLTIIATTINSILVSDGRFMLYPFIQFVILIIGYISSHLVVVDKEERKQFDIKLSFYFVGLLAFSAGIFYLLYDYVRVVFIQAWEGFILLFSKVIWGIARFLSFLKLDVGELPEPDPIMESEEDGEHFNKLPEFNIIETITFWVVVAAIVFFLVIAIFYLSILFKQRFRGKITQASSHEAVSYTQLDDRVGPSNWLTTNPVKKYLKKPNHPVRKMILQFEQKAARMKKGRNNYETVEDWLGRMGLHDNLATYQKVRYGEKDVTDQEIDQLKAQLKEIELNLKSTNS